MTSSRGGPPGVSRRESSRVAAGPSTPPCGGPGSVAAAALEKRSRRWSPDRGRGGGSLPPGTSGALRGTSRTSTPYSMSARSLCGGTSPGVALRSRDVMARFPRKCDACDGRHVALSWITGGPGHPGVAWCEECLDGAGHLSPWAWVLRWGRSVGGSCVGGPRDTPMHGGRGLEGHDQLLRGLAPV